MKTESWKGPLIAIADKEGEAMNPNAGAQADEEREDHDGEDKDRDKEEEDVAPVGPVSESEIEGHADEPMPLVRWLQNVLKAPHMQTNRTHVLK